MKIGAVLEPSLKAGFHSSTLCSLTDIKFAQFLLEVERILPSPVVWMTLMSFSFRYPYQLSS